MTHAVSPFGIVGLGALGLALESFLKHGTTAQPQTLIIAVKSFDLEQALLEHQQKWPETTPFVTMSNGFIEPILLAFSKKFPTRLLRVGVTTLGSTLDEQKRIHIFSEGSWTAWGPFDETSNVQVSLDEQRLLKLLPNARWESSMKPIIRKKWVFNAVINSITAAHRLPQNKMCYQYEEDVNQAFDEAIQLASILWSNIPWTESRNELQDQLWQVIDSTASNENSMAKDVRLGRKTESNFLAGISLHYEGFPKLKALHNKIISIVN